MTEQTLTLSEVEYVEMRSGLLTAIAVLDAVGKHDDARSYRELLAHFDIRWDAEYEARKS